MERRSSEYEGSDYWLVRDLPTDVDVDDAEGLYGTKFGELWSTDTEYEWPELLRWYKESDASTRAIINRVFVRLIGYTLPSLADLAQGRDESVLP